MKIVIGTPLNALNKHHIERWVTFHGLYADVLVVVIDSFEKDLLQAEIDYMLNLNVKVYEIDTELRNHPIKTEFCLKKILLEEPDWMGIIPSDEIFSSNFFKEDLFEDPDCLWYSFPVCHLWGDDRKHRVDSWWGASLINVPDNIKIYRNFSNSYIFTYQGLHSSMVPFEVRTNPNGKFIPEVVIKHYAFLDPKDWDRRCEAYGKEYETGGGKEAFPVSESIELKELICL